VINQWLLGRALLGEIPEVLPPRTPIRSLFIYNSNPVVVVPEQDRVLAGLRRDDLFTVVHDQFVTDTARYADLVLPACTMAEHLDVMVSWGSFYIALNRPAIPPIGEAVPNTELFRRLARALELDEPFLQRTDEQILEDVLDWSAPALARQGGLEALHERGFLRYVEGGPDVYAPYREGGFPTPSGKVELESAMARGGNLVPSIFRQGSEEFQAGGEVDPLPGYRAPADADGAGFPLTLLSPKSHALLNSQYGNIERQRRHAGEQQVTIHPSDARERGIEEHERVRIFNQRGEFSAVVRLSEDVLPGVVVAPLGYWAASNGGSTVAAVCSDRFADLGRAPTFSDTRVEVERFSA
jgi:anaerobic selenocysteine-containing dehydrogenase